MPFNFNQRANLLAQQFWELKSILESGMEEQRELAEIEKLLSQGVGGKLRDQLEYRASELRSIIEHKRTAQERLSQVRRELLELVSEFAPALDLWDKGVFRYDPDSGNLSQDFFRAITEILFSNALPKLEFSCGTMDSEGIKLNSSNIISALKSLSYITMILQESSKKLLGKENLIDKTWEKLKRREFGLLGFSVLCDAGDQIDLLEIQRICELADWDYRGLMKEHYVRKLMEEVENLASDEWDPAIVEKQGDKYRVTDFGKWTWELCKNSIKLRPEPSVISKIISLIKRRSK